MGRDIGKVDAAAMYRETAAFRAAHSAFRGSEADEVLARASGRIAEVRAELRLDLKAARDAMARGDETRARRAVREAQADTHALQAAFVTARDAAAATVDYRHLREGLDERTPGTPPPRGNGGNMPALRRRIEYRQRSGELPTFGRALPEKLRDERLRPERELLYPNVAGRAERAAPFAVGFERVAGIVDEVVSEAIRDANAVAGADDVEVPLSELHTDSMVALDALEMQLSMLGDLLTQRNIPAAMRSLEGVGALEPREMRTRQAVLAWEFEGAGRGDLETLTRIERDLAAFANEIQRELARERDLLGVAVERGRRTRSLSPRVGHRAVDGDGRRYRTYASSVRNEMAREEKVRDDVRALHDVVRLARQRLIERQQTGAVTEP